jgi:hypothetical protein
VFDRGYSATLAVAEHRAEFRCSDGEMPGVDEAVMAAVKAGSEKYDAMIGFGGVEDNPDLVPGVNTDPGEGDGRPKGSLMALFHYSRPRP